ncbi:MlaD family protein [Gordonia malaquae]|uniref:MlaD family protein n=1 Tax=Gordonia malaquae TaxID=410332 RepID=UPI0030FEB282
MKPARRATLLVMAFVMLIGAAMFVVVRVMVEPVPGDKDRYTAMFTDVSGLFDGDAVRLAGVAVGKIESIDLDGAAARVVFTVVREHRLDDNSVIAVRYQNLLGQHYLEVVRRPRPGGPQDPAQTIAVTRTVPSFDVTDLFNNVLPLINDVDPKILNTFAENIGLLLQGDGRGLAPAANAVKSILSTVNRRDVVIIAMVDNLNRLADQIGGRSGDVGKLVEQLNASISRFTTSVEVVKESLSYGDRVLVPFVDLLETMQGSYDDNFGPLDAFFRRVVPFSPQLLDALGAIPGLLSSIAGTDAKAASATFSCQNGRLDLPVITRVLIGGRDVVVCR